MKDDEGLSERQEARSDDVEMSEEEIDYNVMGTFPASDPPSWTLGIDPHKKSQSEFEEGQPSTNDPSHQNEIISPDE
jgi:hypothetical protein